MTLGERPTAGGSDSAAPSCGRCSSSPQVRRARRAGRGKRGKDADVRAAEVLSCGGGRAPGQPALLGEQPEEGRGGGRELEKQRLWPASGMMECGVSARAAR